MSKKFFVLLMSILTICLSLPIYANANKLNGTPKAIRGAWITNNLSKSKKSKSFLSVDITKNNIVGEEHGIAKINGEMVCMSDSAITQISKASHIKMGKNNFRVLSHQKYGLATTNSSIKLFHRKGKDFLLIKNDGDTQNIPIMHRISRAYLKKLNNYHMK